MYKTSPGVVKYSVIIFYNFFKGIVYEGASGGFMEAMDLRLAKISNSSSENESSSNIDCWWMILVSC